MENFRVKISNENDFNRMIEAFPQIIFGFPISIEQITYTLNSEFGFMWCSSVCNECAKFGLSICEKRDYPLLTIDEAIQKYSTVNHDYTIEETKGYEKILVNASSNDITITLPSLAEIENKNFISEEAPEPKFKIGDEVYLKGKIVGFTMESKMSIVKFVPIAASVYLNCDRTSLIKIIEKQEAQEKQITHPTEQYRHVEKKASVMWGDKDLHEEDEDLYILRG